MSENSIELRPVEKLFKKAFYIPDFQRGYRWGEQQVEDLLNDLEEFCTQVKIDKKDENKTVYCLQPLVVKYDVVNKKYNVIDGQQRLTTIKILLSCLGEEETYSVEYQTREESTRFLSSISEITEQNEKWKTNADYYHMYKAKETITGWLKRNKVIKEDFLTMIKERVVFVWYESDEKDQIKVFTRLNIGKIGLTESELIKAMFLSRNNFSQKTTTEDELLTLVEIANEWDKIEYRLQDDRFWLFFHGTEYDKPTRIDYILDLARRIQAPESNNKGDMHPTFRYFYDKFKKAENQQKYLTTQWEEISQIYQTLEEWYNDEVIYHYIGYLCALLKDDEVYDLLKIFKGYKEVKLKKRQQNKKIETKQAFIDYLKSRIKHLCGDMDLDREYEGENPPKTEAKPILLLHSVQTILDQNASIKAEKKYSLPDFVRFPFHLFKKENWDVEHIRPNSSEDYEGDRKKSARKKYVYVLRQYQDGDIQKAIEEYESMDETEEAFHKLWETLTQNGDNHNELSETHKNQIWNYVLLDASTNREYGNSCFAIKREYVLKKEKGIKPELKVEKKNNKDVVEQKDNKEAAFVPIVTQNVFSKAYTPYPEDLKYWTEKDAAYYRMDIEKTLWWCLDGMPEDFTEEKVREEQYKEYKKETIDAGRYGITFKNWYKERREKTNG